MYNTRHDLGESWQDVLSGDLAYAIFDFGSPPIEVTTWRPPYGHLIFFIMDVRSGSAVTLRPEALPDDHTPHPFFYP